MLRLFAGLAVPWDLAVRMEPLMKGLPGARFVDEDNLHLTLRFIGEVTHDDAEEIAHEISRIDHPLITLACQGLGTFGESHLAHSLWVDLKPNDSLAALQKKVDGAVVRAGQPREGRKFKPHITIARTRGVHADRLHSYLERHAGFRAPPVTIDHITLFSSVLHKDGSIYTPEVDFPLST